MAAIAGLITAIVFGVLVVGAFFVIYFPPKRLKRFSLKGIEFELQPVEVPVLVAPVNTAIAEVVTAEPGTPERAPTPIDPAPAKVVEEGEKPDDNWPKIWEHFNAGEFKAGLVLVKQEVAKEADPSKSAGLEALFLNFAFVKGSSDAFAELEKRAIAHPNNPGVHFWFGRSLERSGRVDDAIATWRNALTAAKDEADRMPLVLAMQGALSALERNDEARAILQTELVRTNAPDRRADLFVGLSKTYESEKPPEHDKAAMMRELAIRLTPADKDLRFRVAYDYSEHDADELAFVNYRALIRLDEKYASAKNNAGVSADRLSLPITSVAYYKEAQVLGETLPSANLAQRLIAAGFRQEAMAILDEARKAAHVHRNVHHALGQLASAEAAEEQKIKDITERVGKVRKFRVLYAEALLQSTPAPADLSGTYIGVPSPLTELKVAEDGTASATFLGITPSTLSGKVEGRTLAFQWTEVAPSTSSWLPRKSGHGVLLIGTNRLDGYWSEGTNDLDSKGGDKWTEWHLTKNAPTG